MREETLTDLAESILLALRNCEQSWEGRLAAVRQVLHDHGVAMKQSN